MKVAIYHNLKKGGALEYLLKIISILSTSNTIDIYCHRKILNNNKNIKLHIIKLKKVNNIIDYTYLYLFKIRNICKKFGYIINNGNYDLVIIGQCFITQSPYILRYINQDKTKVIYLFNEHLREFYEPTTYDYYNIKKILGRIIRYPIKYIDQRNCKCAKNIISCSKYISSKLKTLYGKNSYVIKPGYKKIKPQKIRIRNNKNICSIGILSKIKGYDFSIKQVETNKYDILGNNSHESIYIKNLIKSLTNINIIHNNNNHYKQNFLNKHAIYLANNFYEPFGISTLEAIDAGCFVLGVKEGGTPEIVKDKLNGHLYPRNLNQAKKILKYYLSKKHLDFFKCARIDWLYSTRLLLSYVKKIK